MCFVLVYNFDLVEQDRIIYSFIKEKRCYIVIVYCYILVFIYPVHVHTAKKTGAGTDSNVFLNIFGSQGDTGQRPLMFSKTNRNKFEKGNVSYYILTSELFL